MPAVLNDTPIEYHEGFAVKREDLCCPDIPLSKMRGLYPLIESRAESIIACTDTFRSWNGLCTAIVCARLGKKAIIFYPDYKRGKREGQIHPIQQLARDRWGATLVPAPANRQAQMLFYAREYLKLLGPSGVYMLNTGFRFAETRERVAKEAAKLRGMFSQIVVPTGTGTHLSGVIAGQTGAQVIAILGYSQNHPRLRKYAGGEFELVDETYDYADKVEMELPFDANPYYETKAWLWMTTNLRPSKKTLLWNIGGARPDPSIVD